MAEPAAEISAVDTYGLSRDMISFIKSALNEDFSGQNDIADKLSELADSIADAINEAFADGFGDVILESSDSGYVVIDDYKEDIEEWLSKTEG